ncbi:hypothetical protein DPEC_G00339910 [Dallia pectoralis]|uniref:Uncharacterized protein n=1 Tax=Dallia pectoralis TaxID=75939 RepID=A0ACC2F4Z0_DALPE|nr:hypothetical protein DPEC_G00339910 [Dallia pectoralis]
MRDKVGGVLLKRTSYAFPALVSTQKCTFAEGTQNMTARAESLKSHGAVKHTGCQSITTGSLAMKATSGETYDTGRGRSGPPGRKRNPTTVCGTELAVIG